MGGFHAIIGRVSDNVPFSLLGSIGWQPRDAHH
jgi:hypothetical protein